MKLKTSDLAICAEVSHFIVRDFSDQGLLGPVPRAESSNYRSFDPRQIPQLHLVKSLREMGCSSKQLMDYAQKRTPDMARDLFRRYSAQLSDEIAMLQAKLDSLQSYLALIDEGKAAVPGEIALRSLSEQPIHFSSLENFSGKTKGIERLHRAHGQIRQHGNAGCPLGYAYHDFLDFLERPEQPSLLVSYDPHGPDRRPAGEYLVGTEVCSYEDSCKLPRRMFEYALRHGLDLCGPAYTVYLFDAASVTGTEEYLIQIAVAAKQPEFALKDSEES